MVSKRGGLYSTSFSVALCTIFHEAKRTVEKIFEI